MIKKNNLDAQIVLVDDNSNDSTSEICDAFQKKYENILAIHRINNSGMGNALIEGTKKASGSVIVWVMADLSDDLNTIPKFLKKIEDGYDLVFGSRYMKGGSSGDIPYMKALFSRNFTNLTRIFMGINVHDITNAFRAFKKELLENIHLESTDFAISPEFAIKAKIKGFKLGEVPTKYFNRKLGRTKFKMLKMGIRYVSLFKYRLKKID